MKNLFLTIIIITSLSCKSQLDNWITFSDKFNIGSILLPKQPLESVDTIVTPTFKLIQCANVIALDNKVISPSAFNYSIIFPTNINDFDFFKMKKDSNVVNTLFNNMINGAINNSNSILISKEYFHYPEPGVKITLHNSISKQTSVTRIIIFDDFVINTNATGKDSDFDNKIEETYFNSLKVNSDKRTRK